MPDTPEYKTGPARKGRKSHEPTPKTRQIVESHARVGTQQEVIAKILGLDSKTLRKWYRNELDLSIAQANATIGGELFEKAKSGDTAAMIFWMKTRARWREKDHGEDNDKPPPTIIINMPKTDDS